jgi:hypothetical protein
MCCEIDLSELEWLQPVWLSGQWCVKYLTSGCWHNTDRRDSRLLQTSTSMSSSWFGIRHVFILYFHQPWRTNSSGDSYSATGYDVQGPHPDETNPLGNPAFPGETTAEDANWVGYVITNYSKTNTLFYNFAIPGSMVQGVSAQRRLSFLHGPGKRPDWAPWNSHDSLFGTAPCMRAKNSLVGGNKRHGSGDAVRGTNRRVISSRDESV